MKRFLIVLTVTCYLLNGSSVFAEAKKQLVRFEGLTRSQIFEIGARGFDVAKAGPDFVEVVVSEEELKLLPATKSPPKIIIHDINGYVAGILANQRVGAEYYNYDRLTSTLNNWAQQYSSIARLCSIGKTFEGRDILAMEVTENPDANQPKPAALIDGAHHSREWISMEVAMEALKEILEGYGKDQNLTRLVKERKIWFVPLVNPDGLVYNQTKDGFWRKNRRPIDGTHFGVDLNRNYGYQWGGLGASTDPSADTFRGSGPFSEAETLAIKGLAEREHFQVSVSFHSYSELILYPFGYAKGVSCPGDPTFKSLAQGMSQFNHYAPMKSAELYPASGDSDDWLYGTQKTFAVTVEIGTLYIPPADQIADICKINVPAVFYAIDKAGSYALTTPGSTFSPNSYRDPQTGLEAIIDGMHLIKDLPEDLQLETNDRLRSVGVRLSEIAAEEILQGNKVTWNFIQNTPEASFVMPLVQNRLSFSKVHGEKSN
ncbi:MAG: zinc carboxypeptidase [Candidatus Riflebacteria bacterium]|nr:zinc carboxypeptidase [Candidatus Riflebacteria bacterium]